VFVAGPTVVGRNGRSLRLSEAMKGYSERKRVTRQGEVWQGEVGLSLAPQLTIFTGATAANPPPFVILLGRRRNDPH
jgi:hypothetical protein